MQCNRSYVAVPFSNAQLVWNVSAAQPFADGVHSVVIPKGVDYGSLSLWMLAPVLPASGVVIFGEVRRSVYQQLVLLSSLGAQVSKLAAGSYQRFQTILDGTTRVNVAFQPPSGGAGPEPVTLAYSWSGGAGQIAPATITCTANGNTGFALYPASKQAACY
jgi:hypothetical protein